MNGAEALINALNRENTKYIFAYPGAANCPILDKLSSSGIKTVLARSEQAAAHMASGYARASGLCGVCTATSGPGATNIITGIATAYMDSVPMVIITGQVETELIGTDAFQEADITGATTPFTKHNYLVKDANDIERIVSESFYIASTGRPGPVLIDIPLDVQKAEVTERFSSSINIRGYKFSAEPNELQTKRVAQSIRKSKRPLFVIGGGAASSHAEEEIRSLKNKTCIPAVSTMNGLGVIPSNDKLYCKMAGIHGTKAANTAVKEADLLIALGARLGNRSFTNLYMPEKKQKLVHVDIDPAEIGKCIRPYLPVVGDIKEFICRLSHYLGDYKTDSAWCERIENLPTETESENYDGYVNPHLFIKELSKQCPDAYVTTEVGQNQIWTVNNLNISSPHKIIMSAGLGTMGYGLSAAIGARAASGKTVISVAGDGSFQMNFAEMATMLQSGLPVKMVVFKNNALGMVREVQKTEYNENYICTSLDASPDYCILASAYGIKSSRITDNENIRYAISQMLSDDKPYLLEVNVNPNEKTI